MSTMPDHPVALLIRTAGTNCDAELARAFAMAGATPRLVHVDALAADPSPLLSAPIIAFPGGFSYGDDVGAGRVLAVKARQRLWPALRDAIAGGALVLGVCNGFQVLTQLGLLPGPDADGWDTHAAEPPAPTVALAENSGGRFIDRWCRLEADPASPCVWTSGLSSVDAERLTLPIAHGEGRVIASDPSLVDRLMASGQAPLRYAASDNPNGSAGHVAGLCDRTGRVFGLMPHPERYLTWAHHPAGTRLAPSDEPTPGLRIFQNAVVAVRAHANA
jgi:phosphoribosylformylglycinamidine synthase I